MKKKISHWEISVRRAVDIVVAGTAIAVMAAPALFIAGAVWWKMGTPVLFVQSRYGLDGRPFDILKFRSMTSDDKSLNSQDRITSFGAFLRKRTLDELPQLWNVLMGEMSLVGPRPYPVEAEGGAYPINFLQRCQIKPGLTCSYKLFVRPGENMSHAEVLRHDFDYMERRKSSSMISMTRYDLEILFGSVAKAATGGNDRFPEALRPIGDSVHSPQAARQDQVL